MLSDWILKPEESMLDYDGLDHRRILQAAINHP